MLVADRAAGAGTVEHDHGLAEILGHAVREQPRGYVGRRTGRKQHRDLDRTSFREWWLLREHGTGESEQQNARERGSHSPVRIHWRPPVNPWREFPQPRLDAPRVLTRRQRGSPRGK